MMQAQMIEGTTEEVTRQMQQSYAGRKLRVFIEPEDDEMEAGEDLAAGLPEPPFTVHSREHLVELLEEGMSSPVSEFTDNTLEQMRLEVKKRLAQGQP
jgi:hypothetical protein